ncbi:hypothetical protein [Desulfonatronum thioautotrophicum]|uniref:hypothetical protein n=1 Tax=Desulfonatronum thioautotrophicum TaxID=617001 RepID=UPI0005EB4BAC|nr:hypothetical protein [Desulfonatronum thioautotrophicum]
MGFFISASQESRFVLHRLNVREFRERLTAFSVQVIEGWAELKSMDRLNDEYAKTVAEFNAG